MDNILSFFGWHWICSTEIDTSMRFLKAVPSLNVDAVIAKAALAPYFKDEKHISFFWLQTSYFMLTFFLDSHSNFALKILFVGNEFDEMQLKTWENK